MAHGEAEHGCAQDGHCRPGHHELPATKQHRWLAGGVPGETPSGPSSERAAEDSAVPRQRSAESVGSPSSPLRDCLSSLPGWAGGHRHGPVRPRTRAGRPGRPPSRWC
ncbi:hypothetical protein [Salinispora pacifica]|uniref:hypothetical protein n=1 Tax=Salinispora pacifica TaxID=351187 RepID=UPI0004754474